jgi:PAS domain S-box-containing protein
MRPDVFVEVLLRSASDGIAVSERESGRFVVVSDSYCALTGYARDELIGRTSVELGLIVDQAVRSGALDRPDRGLGNLYELRIRRKDGEIRLFEFSPASRGGLRRSCGIVRSGSVCWRRIRAT